MRVASYYKYCPDKQEGFGMSLTGQGARRYWEQAIGIMLPKLLGDATLVGRRYGYDHKLINIHSYPVLDGNFDIAYCQTFDIPLKRPDAWVYGFIDDVEYNEPQLENYLENVRPDILFTVQDNRQKVHDICGKYDTKVIFLPWFNVENQPVVDRERDILAMSTGAIGPCYKKRTAICEYLKSLNRHDVILSTTYNQTTYPLSNEQYIDALKRCRYYISCGVLDFEIPSKFFEVANYGACIVSFDMPMMRECGFINELTYIKIDRVEQISEIIKSDMWRKIGPAGQDMVHKEHTIQKRAEQILEIYKNF